MTEGFLESRGIAYRTNEFREGRSTLVFIHGLSGSASAWQSIEDKLQNDYNLVTYDLRGHGLSKKYVGYGDYKIENFSDDLIQLLSHLNIGACSLVAHSFGTIIALEAMLAAKSQIVSAAFLSINYKIYTLPRSRMSLPFLVIATSLLGLLPFSPRKGTRLDYRNIGYSPDWSFRRIYPEIRELTLRIYLYCLRHIYQYKHDRWGAIKQPVLLIHGGGDSFVPASHAIAAKQEIPNAQLQLIGKANHMLVLNNADRVIEAVRDFIE